MVSYDCRANDGQSTIGDALPTASLTFCPIIMRFLLRTFVAVVIASFHIGAQAADAVRMATATPGGSFSAFGQALKEALAEVDSTLQIELLATRGSAENLPMLEAGTIDLAMVEGTLLHQHLSSTQGKPFAPKVLTAMFPTPGMFVVRADSAFRSVADLRGHKVVFGAAGSGFVVLARYVLDGLGLDQQTDFNAVLLKAAKDGPPMVLNGDPAALWGGGLGWPAFDAVARGPVGARFIGLTADEVEQVRAKHSFLRPMEVSAGAYAGQSEAAQTVGSWSWLMTRADLPEATVVRLARAIDRAQTGLLRRFAAAEAHARATLAALPAAVELHEGVSRYHREVGRSP